MRARSITVISFVTFETWGMSTRRSSIVAARPLKPRAPSTPTVIVIESFSSLFPAVSGASAFRRLR